ncbi:MAG: hypothetical protein H0X39_10680 [Actinobacteria bacterium]|nr:hypothetical protein [Actinomycetota bacterium]
MELTRARIADNQSRFREANENIEAGAEKVGYGPIPFICECADTRCMEIVQLTFQAYESIRVHPVASSTCADMSCSRWTPGPLL